MRDYKNITAYKMADELAVKTYRLTRDFPKEELYGLTSQLRRAAISVPSNIAEGASRQHKRDYLNFLFIARGSLAEVEYLLHLARRLGYLGEAEHERIDGLRQQVAKTLFGLIGAVEREAKPLLRMLGVLSVFGLANLIRSLVFGPWSLVQTMVSPRVSG